MAARFRTKKYTLGASAVSLRTILNDPRDDYASSLTVRAGKANRGDVVWRDAGDGEDGGFLEPREAATFDLTGKFIAAKDIIFSGTTGDILYLTVIG